MKRSIIYAGLFSVMAAVPAMTNQAFAADTGNLSDAVSNSLTPSINWVEMPETAPDVSSAVPPPPEQPNATTPTTPSGGGQNAPSAGDQDQPSGGDQDQHSGGDQDQHSGRDQNNKKIKK
jgi:hypothetical protein